MQNGIINKLTSTLILFGLVLVSCHKVNPGLEPTPPPPPPPTKMEYFDLGNKEINAKKGFSIDLNHDGIKDIAFYVDLLGDPINKVDKWQFLASTNRGVGLPVNGNEEIPVMNAGDLIALDDFNGFRWWDLSSIVLVQKVVSYDPPDIWEGHWKNATHKYLPLQIINNAKRFNGWVELSVEIANERIILHRAALSTEPEKTINAGA
jgi:hypothetical protein